MKIAIQTEYRKQTGQGPFIIEGQSVEKVKKTFEKCYPVETVISAKEVHFIPETGEWK